MRRLGEIPAHDLYTSTICLMEMRYGSSLRDSGELWERISQEILPHASLLPFGREEAIKCGDVLAQLSKNGTPIGIEDTQIGATALVHNCTVVTFNEKHFEKIPGLKVETWLD